MEKRKKENETTKEEISKMLKEINQVNETMPRMNYADALKKTGNFEYFDSYYYYGN